MRRYQCLAWSAESHGLNSPESHLPYNALRCRLTREARAQARPPPPASTLTHGVPAVYPNHCVSIQTMRRNTEENLAFCGLGMGLAFVRFCRSCASVVPHNISFI